MEFLARSWSLSAAELAKALCTNHTINQQKPLPSPDHGSADTHGPIPTATPESLYKSVVKGETIGRKLKDQKERKKQEMRTHNAKLHAAVSVAGVAAAVAALAASTMAPALDASANASNHKVSCSKTSAYLASAADLVASHCIDIAEEMGADPDQIITVVRSAVSARTNGDVMTLTAAAATTLKGAATLNAKQQNGYDPFQAACLADEKLEDGKKRITAALSFIGQGDELLKRTRKGDLSYTSIGDHHRKLVSFCINSKWQVVIKMKIKHTGGSFTKKKKCVVCGIQSDIPTWAGKDNGSEKRAYFGVKTTDRMIEFECRDEGTKQMWVEGLRHLLHSNHVYTNSTLRSLESRKICTLRTHPSIAQGRALMTNAGPKECQSQKPPEFESHEEKKKKSIHLLFRSHWWLSGTNMMNEMKTSIRFLMMQHTQHNN